MEQNNNRNSFNNTSVRNNGGYYQGRPVENNDGDSHLSANMICDYEKVFNYGDFYSYSFYPLTSMLYNLINKLSKYCFRNES